MRILLHAPLLVWLAVAAALSTVVAVAAAGAGATGADSAEQAQPPGSWAAAVQMRSRMIDLVAADTRPSNQLAAWADEVAATAQRHAVDGSAPGPDGWGTVAAAAQRLADADSEAEVVAARRWLLAAADQLTSAAESLPPPPPADVAPQPTQTPDRPPQVQPDPLRRDHLDLFMWGPHGGVGLPWLAAPLRPPALPTR